MNLNKFMIKKIICGLMLCLSLGSANAQQNKCLAKSCRSLSLPAEKAEWFREAKFGMFLHWGLYSMLEGSYKGRTLPDTTLRHGKSWYAEWIQPRLEVPMDEYKALAKSFNPIKYNAEVWVREAKNAGMRYIVLTSKHHDGFALWASEVSDFDVMNTPYKRDVIDELVKACKKYGMKYGFYYSHWQDWTFEGGARPHWEPTVDDKAFEKYWQEKSLPQVQELLVKYDPDLLWFDTWNEKCHITEQRRDELIALIRANSDKCLINGRICFTNPGENIDFLEMFDNDYPEEIINKPWQTPATMQHSWGYHAKDYNWKSADEMLRYLVNNTSKGGNYLLNIGPKADGSLPLPAIRRLREMGAWLMANGEAVYGAKPLNIETPEGVYVTYKVIDGKSYAYVFLTQPIKLFALNLNAKKAFVLETEQPVPVYTDKLIFEKGEEYEATFAIPADLFRDSSIQVLKVELQ